MFQRRLSYCVFSGASVSHANLTLCCPAQALVSVLSRSGRGLLQDIAYQVNCLRDSTRSIDGACLSFEAARPRGRESATAEVSWPKMTILARFEEKVAINMRKRYHKTTSVSKVRIQGTAPELSCARRTDTKRLKWGASTGDLSHLSWAKYRRQGYQVYSRLENRDNPLLTRFYLTGRAKPKRSWSGTLELS